MTIDSKLDKIGDIENKGGFIVMRKRFAVVLIVSLFLHFYLLKAEGKWVEDKETGCQVWTLENLPNVHFYWSDGRWPRKYINQNVHVSWSGHCINGKAHGKGYLKFYDHSRLTGTYEGEMKYGKFNGFGIFCSAKGINYEGEWKDGLRHGEGTRITGRKYNIRENWEEGTLRTHYTIRSDSDSEIGGDELGIMAALAIGYLGLKYVSNIAKDTKETFSNFGQNVETGRLQSSSSHSNSLHKFEVKFACKAYGVGAERTEATTIEVYAKSKSEAEDIVIKQYGKICAKKKGKGLFGMDYNMLVKILYCHKLN